MLAAPAFTLLVGACAIGAGCTPAVPPEAETGPEAACVAAVAAHVGRPTADVVVVAASPGMVAARDGDRVHRCDMAGTEVRAIVHPEAGR